MISEMSILTGSSLSQYSCSPRSIWISEAAVPSTQWLAVRIHSSLMTVAPQKTEELPDQTIPACHGHSLTSTSWPPTILVDLWAMPQVQSPDPVPPDPEPGYPDPDPDPDPVPPDPEPGYPDPEPGYPDPDPVGGIGGIPEPPVPMSLGMWT